MNELQRGIAAYKAISRKVKGSGSKRSKSGEAASLKVTVDIKGKKTSDGGARGESAGHGAAPGAKGRSALPAGGKGAAARAKEAHEPGRSSGSHEPARPKAAVARSSVAGSRSNAAAGQTSTEELLKAEAGGRGYRKVAKFLLLLGQDEAAKILKHFTPDEIEGISREIARIRSVDGTEAKDLLSEFGVVQKRSHRVTAGPETARAMLVAAFGEERGKALLRRVVPNGAEAPFRFLGDIGYEQILLLLKNESAPTVSIILPYLEARKAAQVIEHLPADIQKEVIRRIAKIERIDQEVVSRIEEFLKERIRTQGTVVSQEIDGRSALADILKHMDLSSEEKILEDLADFDPELSQAVKDKVFTIELILKIDDAELQTILRDYDDREIAVILKGKSEPIASKIINNVSSRRAAIVGEEMTALGRMRRAEVDKATKEFLDYLIELDDQRKISIHWDDRVVE